MCVDGKKKYWQCAHFEYEYGDLDRYCWCHNKLIPSRECKCKNIFQMNACPGFCRGERYVFLTMTKDDILDLERFKEAVRKESLEREMQEISVLRYLKQKYEGV